MSSRLRHLVYSSQWFRRNHLACWLALLVGNIREWRDKTARRKGRKGGRPTLLSIQKHSFSVGPRYKDHSCHLAMTKLCLEFVLVRLSRAHGGIHPWNSFTGYPLGIGREIRSLLVGAAWSSSNGLLLPIRSSHAVAFFFFIYFVFLSSCLASFRHFYYFFFFFPFTRTMGFSHIFKNKRHQNLILLKPSLYIVKDIFFVFIGLFFFSHK